MFVIALSKTCSRAARARSLAGAGAQRPLGFTRNASVWRNVRPVSDTDAFVVEAELVLRDGIDPAAVGAAVTVELCGHWQHAGSCRWPHNSAIETQRDRARFRTLFVADEPEAALVRERIETALRGGLGWRVLLVQSRPVAEAERVLAERLLAEPRLAR